MTPATFLAFPIAIGLAWTGGNMAARLQMPPAAKVESCAMRFGLADRGSQLVVDVPCRMVPAAVAQPGSIVGKQLAAKPRVHPVKMFYDRVPAEDTPASARMAAAAGKGDGCKPGRTRNGQGKCGVWR